MEEHGFQAEYAKSDRSSCRLCKNNISQSSLRLAILVQSPHFDGKIPMWYHYTCFFKKAKPKATTQIKGFDSLRWDDQQNIKQKLGLATSTLTNNDNDGGDDDGENGDATSSKSTSIDNFQVEYAKSNRSKCKKCEKKIDKDAIRISKKSSEKKSSESWYHLDCFKNNKAEFEFNFKAENIPGFDQLTDDDKELLKKEIGNDDESNGRKRKIKVEDGVEEKKVKDETVEKEKQLKFQNELFWKYKDQISNELSNDAIKELLEYNDQKIVKTGRDDLITVLADCMCFGALKPCPECTNGQLAYSSKCYYCTGNITEWTKCTYKTQEPEYKEFKIDKDYKDAYDFLKKYKYKPNKRLFAFKLDDGSGNSESIEVKKEPKVEETFDSKKPLNNLKFAFAGKLTNGTNAEVKKIIETFGGKVTTSKLDESICCVLTSKDEFDKATHKKIQEAKSSDIHVVNDDFLNEFDSKSLVCKSHDDLVNLILKYNLGTWGSDMKTRMLSVNVEKKVKNEEEKYCSKSTGTVKMKIKGGAAVDPDSGLENEAHVLREKDGTPYSVVLGLVDIMRGTNSYYKLQILECDKSSKVYLFRSWGRVGTTIGGNKLEQFNGRNDAIAEFENLYLDKTGNYWKDRKNFVKKANKFFPLEIDYGDEAENSDKINNKLVSTNSTLEKPIQDLIRLIFDIEKMKSAMVEFEIDLNKMPLGKLSRNQLTKAFSVLNELTEIIKTTGNKNMILDGSNRFYTLVPHDFGLKKPTLLDSLEIIKTKTDMINNLLDIEIAYSFIKGSDNNEEDPIDQHYKKLKCNMRVMDKNSKEYKLLVDYVHNTHAATHSAYKLDVEDIYIVEREGEYERYDTKFKSLHNKKLLWHGSRITNFAGILSQGLRIAPPEAPATGYMFGKGVYFADMVSKSANYCFTSRDNPTGILLLCEVALGEMYECTASEYVTKLPDGKHSTKGVGRTAPDPKGSIKLENSDIEIPMGKGVDSGVSRSVLLYNEYIVYDVAQVKIRYLLKTKFNYLY